MKRQHLVKLLEMIGSNHDGEALNAARKAHEFVRSNGRTWNDIIAVTSPEVRPVLIEVNSKIRQLEEYDRKSFLQLRERFFEGELTEADARRVTYYRDLLAAKPDDIPF